jgi:phosphoribosyl 1,2-cyclic phosphodiesterase
MQVTVLRSGSKGNATLFSSRGTRVLVDAGVGPRTLMRKLRELDPHDEKGALDAIVITHAHADHVGQASALAKARGIPVYLSEATARHVRLDGRVQIRHYQPREPFRIGALALSPLPLPHDAAQVSFTVDDGARKVALATDLGEPPPGLLDHFRGCDAVLIESNHDVDLLESGPYPDYLKRRILSAKGHLSNAQTHALLRALPRSVRHVVLLHLSATNNRPDLARECARDALSGRDVALSVADQESSLSA